MNVAVVQPIPSPYREGLFELLNQEQSIDLTVYYCAKNISRRKGWLVKPQGYSYQVLPGTVIDQDYFVNPTSFTMLFKHDLLVLSGYSSFTSQSLLMLNHFSRKPIVMWCDSTSFSGRDLKRPILRWMLKKIKGALVCSADGYLVPGRAARSYLERLGADSSAIHRVTFSIDVEYFQSRSASTRRKKEQLRQDLGLDVDFVSLFVGRFVPRKGVMALLEAHKELQSAGLDVGLILVGDGKERERLHSFCQRHRMKAHFAGFVERERLPKIYGLGDVLVLPSTREPWGLVLNEAMACGLPVIATDEVGAAYDLITPRNGIVVDAQDIASLKQALFDLINLSDEDLWEMGRASQRIISTHTHERAKTDFLESVSYFASELETASA